MYQFKIKSLYGLFTFYEYIYFIRTYLEKTNEGRRDTSSTYIVVSYIKMKIFQRSRLFLENLVFLCCFLKMALSFKSYIHTFQIFSSKEKIARIVYRVKRKIANKVLSYYVSAIVICSAALFKCFFLVHLSAYLFYYFIREMVR